MFICALYVSSLKRFSEQFTQCLHCRMFVFTVDPYPDHGALAGGEQHDSHDAFGVDFAAFCRQCRVALELRHCLYQFGSGSRVES